jgi:hypothetical protein
MTGERDAADNASGPARRARDDMNKLTRLLPGGDAAQSPSYPPALMALIDRYLAPLLAENARLVDRIREQAEEIDGLQEQLRQLLRSC